MPHPPDCPSWNYDSFDGWEDVVVEKVKGSLTRLKSGDVDTLRTCLNTKPTHRHWFGDLTPPDYWYFAGYYRGSNFRCLRHYEVMVNGDRTVGEPASEVAHWMRRFRRELEDGFAALDEAATLPHAVLLPVDRLRFTVAFACRVLQGFLQIHPYADGNGHCARWIIWALLGRYGYWPKEFPVHPSPDRSYLRQLLQQYKAGTRAPLETYLYERIMGTS